nr:DUF3152 domain-containing protein [Georgenia sp. SYP-B2076]
MPILRRRALTTVLAAILGVGVLSGGTTPALLEDGGATTAVQRPDAPGSPAGDRGADGEPAVGATDHPTGRPAKAEVTWSPPSAEAVLRAQRARAGLTAAQIPASASGQLVTVPGAAGPPRAAGRVVTVRVEVEAGLPANGSAFADHVMTILNDPRGWGRDGSVVFARTDGAADVGVVLASATLTDALCAPLRTLGRVSCASDGLAVLNVERWSAGAEPFLAAGGTVPAYREYLVNHEVGHLLGHTHVTCPGPGQPAPVMLQQSLDLGGCQPAGWPFP